MSRAVPFSEWRVKMKRGEVSVRKNSAEIFFSVKEECIK
jgi:hypothetical protein